MSGTLLATAPNWAEILTAIGSMLAGITLLVTMAAAIVGVDQLREVRRDRHVHILGEMGERWDSDLLIEARNLSLRYDDVDLGERLPPG